LQRLLKLLGLARWGADELAIAFVSCGFAAYALSIWVHPAAAIVPLWPLAIIVWFFRDPTRAPDRSPWNKPDIYCAPADGTVSDIEEVDEPLFIKGKALRIGIFLSPLNVHVNRTPCSGAVHFIKYAAGEFLPAYNKEAPTRNESVSMGLLTAGGLPIVVKQITGVLARRIVCDAQIGDTLIAGERYGMIKFGSRTEIYVPVGAAPVSLVKIGDKVVGGETEFCRVPEKACVPPVLVAEPDVLLPSAVAASPVSTVGAS
jgi:phosphatidylserine decarboxylase